MMETALQAVAILALAALIVLIIFSIVSLGSIRKMVGETNFVLANLSKDLSDSLKKFTDDFGELKEKLVESLEHVDSATDQLSVTTQKLEKDADEILNTFRPFELLLKEVHDKIAPPIINSARIISAVSKAFAIFTHVLLRDKQE